MIYTNINLNSWLPRAEPHILLNTTPAKNKMAVQSSANAKCFVNSRLRQGVQSVFCLVLHNYLLTTNSIRPNSPIHESQSKCNWQNGEGRKGCNGLLWNRETITICKHIYMYVVILAFSIHTYKYVFINSILYLI